MRNRFKLTTGFLLVSVAIFAIAALVITQSARRNEESSLVDLVSEQSGRDARVIAGVVTGIADSTDAIRQGVAAPSDSPGSFEGLAMSTFLRNSNIVQLSLYHVDGSLVWSSIETTPHLIPDSERAFFGALEGETVTALHKDVAFTSFEGEAAHGDVTATYIPLLDAVTRRPVQVLEVSRDVTATLDARIETARSSMFITVFSTLGGAFFALLGIVLTADILIGKSRAKAVRQERALADEKVVANKLELENQQLRQINEERDRFLSMVSHELRTPLTTIMGFTEVLRRRQSGIEKSRNLEHLSLMRKNGEHLNSLIEEMLEISRIQSGKFEVVKEGFMLDGLLSQVEESGRMMLRPRHQKLHIESDIERVELYGDRKRVMQVLLNLLSNASKYSPNGSTITLIVEQRGGSVQISIGDEGAGIPRDEQRLLFERFYRREDEVTRAESGLGLGLSIVKAIVEAHRGSVDVESNRGTGTVMKVTLPGARKADMPQPRTASYGEVGYEFERLERLNDLRRLPPSAKSA